MATFGLKMKGNKKRSMKASENLGEVATKRNDVQRKKEKYLHASKDSAEPQTEDERRQPRKHVRS